MGHKLKLGYLGDPSSSSTIQTQIVSAANSVGIPSSIALGVAQQESSFNQSAVGSSGEIGVFQLLPSSFPGQDIGDLDTNIQLGVQYLAQLYQQFGNWASALAAYNAGPSRVESGNIPTSTQNYVNSVLTNAGSMGTASPSLPEVDASDDSGSADAASLIPWTPVILVGAVALLGWLALD